MAIKVSVVIPVYNPGEYIEDCIGSLLRQSLPADEFEAIFVDDGSTDDTPARLDELAAKHPHTHVVHQENSGWPGKPRNVGIDRARGEYVMFMDHDDSLGDRALERMYDYGVSNEADIVIGKMAGRGRNVPRELFSKNRPHATLSEDPLIDSLTPHKMFRRAFLNEHRLRFPEGRRRLEDHVFVTEAYFLAAHISVLSDYVCYYHVRRADARNAGFQQMDPVGYFANLREALEIVEGHTTPGPLRDKLLRRWLRVEMVERLRGARLLQVTDDFRSALLREIRGVMQQYMGPSVVAGLPPVQRVVAQLAVRGHLDDLVALADWEKQIKVWSRLDDLGWRDDDTLRIGFSAGLDLDGEPMAVEVRGGKAFVAPTRLPSTVVSLFAAAELTGGALPDRARANLVLRYRESGAEFLIPTESTAEVGAVPEGTSTVLVRGEAVLDPASVLSGSPLEYGLWDVSVRLHSVGWTKDTRLGANRSAQASGEHAPLVVGKPPRTVRPYWTTPHGNLSLQVSRREPSATTSREPARAPRRRWTQHIPAPMRVRLRRVRRAVRTLGG
jgi:glycosyltransferase involved in cell wall biosynthesis